MTPDFCKICPTYIKKGGQCEIYGRCGQWRSWFRHQWALIQKAAKELKKKKEAQHETEQT